MMVRAVSVVTLLLGMLLGVLCEHALGAAWAQAIDRGFITSLEVQRCSKGPRQ